MSYKSELYQQVILDHNKNPRNFREIENETHEKGKQKRNYKKTAPNNTPQ